MTTMILLGGRKGGITKSTLAANIAAGLARKGYRVAAVESDGQGSLARMMGVPSQDGFYRLMAEDAEWADVLVQVPSRFSGDVDLWLLPSSNAQMSIENTDWIGNAVYERFQELRGSFDFVVIDTSPAIHEINSAFYYIADWMILPTLCERPSIEMLHNNTFPYIRSAHKQAEQAHVPAARVLGIVPNRFDARKTTAKINLGYIEGKYSDQVHVFAPLRDLAAWGAAAQVQQSIFTYADGDEALNYERRQSHEATRELNPIIDRVIQVAGATA